MQRNIIYVTIALHMCRMLIAYIVQCNNYMHMWLNSARYIKVVDWTPIIFVLIID